MSERPKVPDKKTRLINPFICEGCHIEFNMTTTDDLKDLSKYFYEMHEEIYCDHCAYTRHQELTLKHIGS